MLNLEVQPQSSCVIEIDSPHNTHLDLQPSRVKKDETDIQSIVELLQTSWTNPLKKIDVINLSVGTTEEVDTRMLLHAKHAAEY